MTRFLLPLMLSLSLFACGDDDVMPGPDAGPSDTGTDDTGGEDTGPVDNGVAGDEIYDGMCADPGCSGTELESACTCLPTPIDLADSPLNQVGCAQLEAPEGVTRNAKDDFCDEDERDGVPELGCLMEGMYRPRGTPEMVTMYGVVDVFGNGGDANTIEVEVCFEGANSMPVDCLPAVTALTELPCSETEIQYENDMEAGERELGFFVIENVPTETPLIIHTSGDPAFWRDIYTYNVYIPNEEIEAEAPACDSDGSVTAPAWEYRARILADSDWTSIPLTAGLVEGVRPESGVVAGEIHDCGDTRLEFAQAAISPRAEVFTYFNDNPDNPLPEVGRTQGTSRLGLYAALDVPEGLVDIAAVGRPDGDVVTLGWYRARVFAGAVTSITLRGFRSTQIPE